MKKKYEVFIIDDQTKINLNPLSKRQRMQYASRFVNARYICGCGSPLKSTRDGRFVDFPHCKIKHKEDCERYKSNNSEERKYINHKDRTMVLIPIRNPNVNIKRKGTRMSRNPKGMKTFYYETLSFVKELILDSYNNGRRKPSLIIHDMLEELNLFNKISVRGLKESTTKFYCGKLSKIDICDRCVWISFISAKGTTLKKNLRIYEHEYAIDKFKNTYKVELNDSMDVLFVMSKSIQGSTEYNIPYFILVSKECLPCNSQLEQIIYNYLENYVKNHNEIAFRKPYVTECYIREDHSYLEDGILQLKDDNGKRIVLEVFGMKTRNYLVNKNAKINYLSSRSSGFKLLSFNKGENFETFIKRLDEGVDWLRSGSY